ncbi:MAG: SPOR domain-containing protein [Myxococcota bacterium]
MARRSNTNRRRLGQGWLTTLLGVLILVVGGFMLGLAVGVVFEEPELVAGHLAGRSTEIEWAAAQVSGRSAKATQAWFATERGGSSESVREAPAVAAAPPVSADLPSSHEFVIQVGAFADSSAAQGLAERLRGSGYLTHVIAPHDDDRWRVRVGPVPGRAEADELALRLKSEERLPTWVLSDSGS